MDANHIHVKNTFLEVNSVSAGDSSDEVLPRAFSDQSHARTSRPIPIPVAPIIASIAEEPSETLSDRSGSAQRLEVDVLESLRTVSRPHESLEQSYKFRPLPAVPITDHGLHFPSFVFPGFNGSGAKALPPVGDYQWHEESRSMGTLDPSRKSFTKLEFDGRLSMVTESSVHSTGVQRYVVLLEEGPVSVADGFGFVLSPSLPCKKNIQKIDSIFLNKKGKICSRIRNELEMLNNTSIGNIEVGSVVELVVDLDTLTASFAIYSPPLGIDQESLSILVRDEHSMSSWLTGSASASIESVVSRTGSRTGHFCAVIKNKHTTIRFL